MPGVFFDTNLGTSTFITSDDKFFYWVGCVFCFSDFLVFSDNYCNFSPFLLLLRGVRRYINNDSTEIIFMRPINLSLLYVRKRAWRAVHSERYQKTALVTTYHTHHTAHYLARLVAVMCNFHFFFFASISIDAAFFKTCIDFWFSFLLEVSDLFVVQSYVCVCTFVVMHLWLSYQDLFVCALLDVRDCSACFWSSI